MTFGKFLLMLLSPLAFLFGLKEKGYGVEKYGPKYCKDALNTVEKFGKDQAKKHNFEFFGYGIGSVVDSYHVKWAINLKGHQHWTVDQARPIVVAILDDFIKMTYNDKVFSVYLNEISRNSSYNTPDKKPENVGFKIAFWDANVERPQPPYIAQIRVVDGKILYFKTNPKDQSLQEPPISETFEEAYSKVGKAYLHTMKQ